MPHPSRRLDLQLVPLGSDASDRVGRAFAELVERQAITSDGWASEGASWLVERGFVRVRSDRSEANRLWANQQGGFRATCPACQTSVIRQLHRVIAGDAKDSVTCEACGAVSHVSALGYRPPAAWGTSALIVCDVATAELTADGLAWAERCLGTYKPVLRRP